MDVAALAQKKKVIIKTSILGEQWSWESYGWLASGYTGKSRKEIQKN